MKKFDSFNTIADPQQAQIEIKGSRFVAVSYPLETEAPAGAEIRKLKILYPDATHICYAYRLGWDSNRIVKTHDAGEPNFTAGKPILNAILSFDLTNILVAVTRWFGGTKLGKANLARAYRKAAEKVLQESIRIEKSIVETIRLQVEIGQYNLVHSILAQNQGEILSQDFNPDCRITGLVPRSKLSMVKEKILQATAGKVNFK
jgi:uncharacterized YigZ family protein